MSENLAVRIRAAAPSDAEDATRLAHLAKGSWGYPAEWMSAWEAELRVSEAYLEENRAWCAEVEGSVAGVCSLERLDAAWEIGFLWVDPVRQGCGIGQRLTEVALEEARRVNPRWPIRVLSDPNATSFYERMGAARVGAQRAPMPGALSRELPILCWSGDGSSS
jgi:predicted N-acetyltransferase YhbS